VRSFDALVGRLRSPEAGGFGISATRAGEVVNEAIRSLASQSQWVMGEVELGETVAGTARYELPANVVDISGLLIGESTAWKRVGSKQWWEFRYGRRSVPASHSGVFAPMFNEESERLVAIFPVPDTTGVTIQALCSLIPADLEEDDIPPFPSDYEQTIMDFAKETLYEEVDEDTVTATVYGNRARARAELLRQRKNSQVGSGPIQAGIWNVHFT
jgi:hypothetical protein